MSDIRAVVNRIQRSPSLSHADSAQIQPLLIDYECWDSLFKLLDTHPADDRELFLYNQKLAIRIHMEYLNDTKASIEWLNKIITNHQVEFGFIWEEVRCWMAEDSQSQAMVLLAIWEKFNKLDCRVKCLEKLCSVYEKKLADDEQTLKHYRILINIDPSNVRALKYFKAMYTYNFQWDQAIATTKKIIQASKGLELYRAAQELAAIYLYSKNLPRQALEILDRYCADSPLDKSMILYDSYMRLEDWDNCIKILQNKISNTKSAVKQSQLHIKIAGLYSREGNFTASAEEYRKAFAKDMNCVEALEAMVGIYAQDGAWSQVLECLIELQGRLSERSQYLRVERLVNRIKKHTA